MAGGLLATFFLGLFLPPPTFFFAGATEDAVEPDADVNLIPEVEPVVAVEPETDVNLMPEVEADVDLNPEAGVVEHEAAPELNLIPELSSA